jgi:hypothetical protein
MKSIRVVLTLTFALIFVVKSASLAEEITYYIEPHTLINERWPGDEYTLSGKIITNGTLGRLAPADIVSYEVQVDGEYSYVFNPSNPVAVVSAGLNATETVIEVMPPTPPSQVDGLRFAATDNTFADCLNCRQFVQWLIPAATGSARVEYQFRDTTDDDPWVYASNPNDAGASILVASVPEPATCTSTIIGLLGVALWERRRRS